MDLHIKYELGSMTIYLENFLDCRNITKFKKLVKLIRQSYTPDEVNKIKEYIEQFNKAYEQKQKECAKCILNYTEKVKFTEQQIKNYIYNRERHKKRSDSWKHYNDYVKKFREEHRESKALLRENKREFDERVKNKAFLDKCLDILK